MAHSEFYKIKLMNQTKQLNFRFSQRRSNTKAQNLWSHPKLSEFILNHKISRWVAACITIADAIWLNVSNALFQHPHICVKRRCLVHFFSPMRCLDLHLIEFQLIFWNMLQDLVLWHIHRLVNLNDIVNRNYIIKRRCSTAWRQQTKYFQQTSQLKCKTTCRLHNTWTSTINQKWRAKIVRDQFQVLFSSQLGRWIVKMQ